METVSRNYFVNKHFGGLYENIIVYLAAEIFGTLPTLNLSNKIAHTVYVYVADVNVTLET